MICAALQMRTCERLACGEEYFARHRRQRYCSRTCSNAVNNARRLAAMTPEERRATTAKAREVRLAMQRRGLPTRALVLECPCGWWMNLRGVITPEDERRFEDDFNRAHAECAKEA